MELMGENEVNKLSNMNMSAYLAGGAGDLTNLMSNYFHYYPYPGNSNSYPIFISETSKFDKSFKIVQKLIEKDMVKCEKVKDFIALVCEIAQLV